MRWLLDTNVISEPARKAPSSEVLSWVGDQRLDTLYTASLAFAEIRAGIGRIVDPNRKVELESWLRHKVRPFFGPRVLEADEATWTFTLSIHASAKTNRKTILIPDLVFGALAERHGMVLVTRNVRDFVGTGVSILNPWLDSPSVVTA
jgi:predicted nucleic acid-binding protein